MNWKLASRIRLITLSVASTVEDRPPVIWRMPVWCAIGTKGVTLLQLIGAPERLHGSSIRDVTDGTTTSGLKVPQLNRFPVSVQQR